MDTEIYIFDNENNEEKSFNLPCDLYEAEDLTLEDIDNNKIIGVTDNYNLFTKLEAYQCGCYESISYLTVAIEDSDNIKETVTKILYHNENYGCSDIQEYVNNFDSIVEKYEVFKNTTPSIWIKNHNEEYKFIDTTNTQDLFHNFNRDNIEVYIRDLVATYGIEEELSDNLYNMDLSTLLDTVEAMGLLNDSMISIENYLDWNNLVQNLRASAFYIDSFKDCVIVHNG
jgi:hypothetical protein